MVRLCVCVCDTVASVTHMSQQGEERKDKKVSDSTLLP